MRALRFAVFACLVAGSFAAVTAQQSDPPLADTRLTVHTLVREDIFGGFIANRIDRLERAERSIDVLLKERPGQEANLLAWRGGASLYRAVVAHEAGRADEFERHYTAARKDFAAAATLPSGNDGVAAITGGSIAVFADRLPEAQRAEAWSQAYDAYALLWKQQAPVVEKLPLHHRGELLSGLTQSAQRTGRADEAAEHLDRMLTLLAGTPYERTARQWKDEPSSIATTNLTCKNCHNPGRLAARIEALGK